MDLISLGVGTSTPALSLPLCRLSVLRSLLRRRLRRRSRTAFLAASPVPARQQAANLGCYDRTDHCWGAILLAQPILEFANGLGVDLRSFTAPMNGTMCWSTCSRYCLIVARSRPAASAVWIQVAPASLTVTLLLGATWTPALTSTLTSAWRASASFFLANVSICRSPR